MQTCDFVVKCCQSTVLGLGFRVWGLGFESYTMESALFLEALDPSPFKVLGDLNPKSLDQQP